MVLVGPQVRHSAHLIHLTVKDRIVHLAPTISDASVDPDVARLAVDLPTQCSEVVRGSRQSASAGAPRPQAVLRCQELPQPDALLMAVCPCLLDAAQEFPQPLAAPEPQCESKLLDPQVAQSERQGESELLQEARSEQVLPRESSCLQEEPQPQAPQGAEQPAPPVSLPRALPFQTRTLQKPRASALQPQAPQVQPLDASAPLSPPRPSPLCPLWPSLPPLLPRPLLPEDVCALSPQHPRVSSSSASSFP
jgi:hypothetical protein